MTAGPGNDMAAAAGGHGRMRASRADRERVIDALKTAFVAERLTKDELGARVGQVYSSRTFAELAAITADLPGTGAGAPPARPPARRPPARRPVTPAKKAALIGAAMTFQPALLVIAIGAGITPLAIVIGMSLVIYPIFVVIAGLGMICSRLERSRGQSPPRPGAMAAART